MLDDFGLITNLITVLYFFHIFLVVLVLNCASFPHDQWRLLLESARETSEHNEHVNSSNSKRSDLDSY